MATEEEELRNLRAKLAELERDRDKYRAAEEAREANLESLRSATEEANARTIALKVEARALRIRLAVRQMAPSFHVKDDEAAFRMLDRSTVEFDSEDLPTPSSVAAAFDAVIVEHPVLLDS